MVKQFLSQRAVTYEERDVSRNRQYAEELVKNTGQMGVPVTVYEGEKVVGFDRPRLEQLVSKIKEGGKISFGAAVADAQTITARQGAAVKKGAYVGKVKPGSAAERAGLRTGDIVTKVDSAEISTAADMERALGGVQKGSRISVVFIRGDVVKKGEAAM